MTGTPSLIPRLGARDGAVLRASQGFGVGTAAQSIAQVEATHRSIVTECRHRYGLGVAVDPETFRNQLPRESRSRSFRRLDYDFAVPWESERDPLSPQAIETYVASVIETQVARSATILIAPYHVVGGINSKGRLTDLRLLERSLEYFAERDLAVPSPNDEYPLERELYAVIAVQLHLLRDPKTRDWLIRQYAGFAASGFAVKIAGLTDWTPPRDVEAAASFLFGLLDAARRPVVLVGGGNLHIAFLLARLPGAAVGLAENEVFTFPPPEGPFGPRALPIFHPAYLRNLIASGQSRRLCEEALRRDPCPCEYHTATSIPRGHQAKLHAYALRVRMTFEVTSIRDSDQYAWLDSRLARAEARAHRLGVRPVQRESWMRILQVSSAFGRIAQQNA